MMELGEALNDELSVLRGRVEQALELFSARWGGPELLQSAMRYAVFSGGKRLRASLTIATAEGLGGVASAAEPGACALEWIHAYSLAHDDLPALDDDDVRRGRPSLHRAYDDATAILVGDALQADAFSLISADLGRGRDATCRARSAEVLAWAAGSHGMVGGQVRDIGLRDADEAALLEMHAEKTGALFVAAAKLGAIAAGADRDIEEALAEWGAHAGAAFQLSDDLLDLMELDPNDTHECEVNLARVLGAEAALALVRKHVTIAAEIARQVALQSKIHGLFVDWILERSELAVEALR